MELWKALDESLVQFSEHFRDLAYKIPEHEIDWRFLHEIFQYLLHIYENMHILESLEPLLAYLGVRATKSKTDKVVVTIYRPSSLIKHL